MNKSFTSTELNIATRDHISRIKRKKKGKQKIPIVRQVILTERLFNNEHIFRQESFVSLSHQRKSSVKNVVKPVR